MAGSNYYLLSALPPLGHFGDRPPLSLAQLREHVADHPGPQAVVDALLLADDLLQREAVLAGELETPEPTVLTSDQLRDEQPLPDYLVGTPTEHIFRIAGDTVWAAYFHHVADLAARRRSGFLTAWVGLEVAVRNALAAARAQALDLAADDYVVAAELADRDADLEATVNEWASARTPLEGLRALDTARWRWLDENDRWFSFSDDEIAAYAARLVLLARWHRISEAAEAVDDVSAPPA